MKREEKNQQTRRRILDSALSEFSARGYGASSINTICAGQDLSKGIVYHYFETKDALFLACVAECFERLTGYLREHLPDESEGEPPSADPKSALEAYFSIRSRFFYTWPVYQRIFCEAVLSPPAHLRGEIHRCRQDFDALNIQILDRLLTPLSLRPGFSKDEVMNAFRQFQDFISLNDQMAGREGQAFDAYEQRCRAALDILLYGVIARSDER